MKLGAGRLVLSATDLANHLACRHLTALDRAVAEGRRSPPAWRDPSLALLAERGRTHEAAFVERLRAGGLDIVELYAFEGDEAVERTLAAMRAGADAVAQALLWDDRWTGRADLLVRVAEQSGLGGWAYEVVDTKLAEETRGGTILQLCLYSDLVGAVQGRAPSFMHVVKPGADFPRETFRYVDFQAYYRLVRGRLDAAADQPPSGETYPLPVEHCEICRWRLECDRRRHADDHLSLVAGIRPLHVGEIERQGMRTLARFADAPHPLPEKPLRGSPEAYARAHGQARIQLRGRREARPAYELLPVEARLGLARLPEPAAGDLFFDIESDPFVDGGGLEYLLGAVCDTAYRAFWATEASAERCAFEALMDLLLERWSAHPAMHVYHFSPYEPAALKRLAGRHGTRERELDRLLRGERFVDLLAVTRQGLRASVESYSLKQLETFFGFQRVVDLSTARAALRRVEQGLERGPGPTEADRATVEGYNRDDCLATAALRRWLEDRRTEALAYGAAVPRPPLASGDPSDALEERSTL